MTDLLWLVGWLVCSVLWVLAVLVAAVLFLELVRDFRTGRSPRA